MASKGTILQIKRTFNAPREKVFKAWIDPEALKRWFAPGDDFTTPVAQVEAKAGGKYLIQMRSPDGKVYTVRGTYIEVRPSEKLVFSWAFEDWEEDQETLVTVDFYDRGASTEIVLTHERFATTELRDDHEQGWSGALERLARIL